jgi:hypothetical protein
MHVSQREAHGRGLPRRPLLLILFTIFLDVRGSG